MRIAILTDGIWPYVIGGMQKHSYFLCKYLAKNRIEILLVHTAREITDDLRTLSCFTPVEKEFIQSVIVEKPLVPAFPGHYIYQSFLYSKKIYEVLGGFPKVDFIIAKGMTGWYFLNRRESGSPPVAINIHGYEFMQRKANFRMRLEAILLSRPLRMINRKADFVFSYGSRITGYIKKLGIPTERIIEVPAAIEREWMAEKIVPSSGVRNFVFVGRSERRKGIEELHEAIMRLSRENEFVFHFVGAISPQDQLNIPHVIYHGVIKDKIRLQSILQNSEILVCPSYSEGMPNVILEGMANGCSVIATDVGAVSLLVNSENGWLIPVANIEELTNAFLEALTIDDADLDKKRNAGYKLIGSNFLWSQVSERLIDSIRKVVLL